MPGIIDSTSGLLKNLVFRSAWTLQGLLDGSQSPPTIQDVFDGLKSFFSSFAFALLPIALVGMIIYGGVQRMLAGDNPQSVAKANQVITWAILGGVVLILAVLLVNLVSGLAGTNNPTF